jgi:SSS family solute:Na+ symporter
MDIAIIIAYLAGILILGIWAGRGIKNITHFSVANRSFGKWIIFATLSASFIGGGFSMGNAEKVFIFGIVNIFALWGFSFSEILVSIFIAPKIRNYPDAISVGDIMAKHYGRPAKIVTGILSVLVCGGILGAQVGAIGYIFNIFLGLPQLYGILIGYGIVITYSTIGGMRAVVFTDIVQFIILTIGIPVTLIFGIQYAGGWSSVKSAIPAGHLTFLGTQKTTLQFIVLFLSFMFGEPLVPPYIQRLFLSKDSISTTKATFWSGLFSIPFFTITGAIGLVALAINPALNPNLSMPFVINRVLPVGLKGIVIASIISIVMSSADSFLNAASVAFTHDILVPIRKKTITGRQILIFARLITIFVGILAVVFAIKIKSILDILLYSYNFWSPVILVPLVTAILGMKTTQKQFIFGSAAGLLSVFIWKFLLHSPAGIDGLIIGIATNFLVFMTIYQFDNKNVIRENE